MDRRRWSGLLGVVVVLGCNETSPPPMADDDASVDAASIDTPAADLPADQPAPSDLPDAATSDVTRDVPTVDVPIVDVPIVDVPIVDVPTVDVPTVDVPTVDVLAIDVPATDVPATDVSICSSCAPRPSAPQSFGLATSRRPTLRWTLPPGVDGAHVDLCRDRALTSGCLSLDATGDHTAPGVDLASGVWFWRLRARVGGVTQPGAGPTWLFRVGARSSAVDTSTAPTLDVNGDGYADLLVGDATNNTVYAHHGGPTGVATAATASLTCATVEGCGETVASTGDVNGDGYGDAFIRGGGALRLHLGGASGLATTATQSISLTGALNLVIAAAGDVDLDGYADVLLGRSGALSIYYGGATGLATRTAAFTCGITAGCGGQVAAAGDVNGDGYADALVGAANGGVEVHLGSATGLVAAPQAALGYRTSFTRAVGLGDVNNDGYGDVAAYSDVSLLYLGSAAGLDPTPAEMLPGGGPAQAGADVDGDGYTDLLASFGNSLQDYPGSSTGIRTIRRSATYLPQGESTRFVAADYNGDGRADVAMNTYRSLPPLGSASGAAGVALSGASGLGSPAALLDPELGGFAAGLALGRNGPDLFNLAAISAGQGTAQVCSNLSANCQFVPHLAGQGFGASVAYSALAGTATGNYLIGAPLAGRVVVMSPGAIASPNVDRATSALSGSAAERFGAAVAGAGDVNNDGVLDVIVGAPEGARAYVFLGSGSSYGGTPITLTGVAGSHFGRVVAGARDVNHDNYADVLVASDDRVQVFLGGASGTQTTPAVTWTGATGAQFGAAIAGVGDVNRDGFADVVVGAPGAASASIYYGAATLPASASAVLTGAAGSEFGAAVRCAGDMNNDGTLDLLVGAPGAASVFLFNGNAAGVAATPSQTVTRNAGSRFGASIAWDGETEVVTTGRLTVAIGATGGSALIYFYQVTCDSLGRNCRMGSSEVGTRAPAIDSTYGASIALRGPARPSRRIRYLSGASSSMCASAS